MSDGYVAALLRERDGYMRAGRFDRARQVDVVLAGLGIAVDGGGEAAVDGAPEKAVQSRPKPRGAKR